jgi:glycosyltransferase involved in cell wall biosynthesis
MNSLLSINNYHYRRGGADAVFLDHDRMFRGLGWSTAVFSMQHPSNEPSDWSPYFVDELEFGNTYGLFRKLIMASKVIYSLEARRCLLRLLRKFHPDIAHVHSVYHHISPSILPLLRERGIPIVLTAHDLKLACPAYKMLNARGICEKCRGGNLTHVVMNRCIRDSLVTSGLVALESAAHRLTRIYRDNLSAIVTPSRFYARKLHEWGWPEQQLRYIPNYIRSDLYEPSETVGSHFLYFGRLAVEKGVATLLQAAHLAGVRLRIVGTGPEEERLKAIASSIGVSVEFFGYRSGPELLEIIRSARAVVLPSEWYENAPMSILEAYASGKPVLGADIGGIPEMILPGKTGFLFQSGNPEELADLLTHVATMTSDVLLEMGRAARHLVEERFTPERYREEMLSLYASVGADILQ